MPCGGFSSNVFLSVKKYHNLRMPIRCARCSSLRFFVAGCSLKAHEKPGTWPDVPFPSPLLGAPLLLKFFHHDARSLFVSLGAGAGLGSLWFGRVADVLFCVPFAMSINDKRGVGR